MRSVMGQFVVYTAVSLDGFIADSGGEVHWLEAFEKDTHGYDAFFGLIGAILMGRVTCEQVLRSGDWPYGNIPTLVWSGKTLEGLPEGVLSWSGNTVQTAEKLRELAGDKDVWVLGGARVIQAFLTAGIIDRLDLFVVPILLGEGVRLFGQEEGEPRMLTLEHVQPYANGVVRMTYRM